MLKIVERKSTLMKISKEKFQRSKKKIIANLNQELEEQIKELKEDKKSQVERFEKIQSNNTLLENKLEQIQKKASRLSGKQIQVKEQEATPVKKKQQKLFIDTQTIKIILTNDRVKMNINEGVMISEEKEHKMDKLNIKQEIPSNKAINKQLK